MSKHVKLLLENVQKPSCTPLGNPAEAETRRGNFDIKLRLSEKRQESSSFMEGRKSIVESNFTPHVFSMVRILRMSAARLISFS